MAIFINDNFEVRKAAPIDTRTQTENLTSLITLPVSYNYQDMLVWVVSKENFYRLASGDGSVIGNWVIATKNLVDETDPELGGNLDAAGFDILNGGTIQGHRGVSNQTDSLIIDLPVADQFINYAIAGDVVVTVDDTSAALPIGTEIEIFHLSGAFDISFAVGGSQAIISKDGNLKIDGIGTAIVLKLVAVNTWALIGSLKA